MPTEAPTMKVDGNALELLEDFARLSLLADRFLTLMTQAYDAASAVEQLVEAESTSGDPLIRTVTVKDGTPERFAISAEWMRELAEKIGNDEDEHAKALFQVVADASEQIEGRLQTFLNEIVELNTWQLRQSMIAAAELSAIASHANQAVRLNLRASGDRADA